MCEFVIRLIHSLINTISCDRLFMRYSGLEYPCFLYFNAIEAMKNSSVASNGLFLSSDKYVLVNFPHQIFFNKNFNFFKWFGAFIVKKLPKKRLILPNIYRIIIIHSKNAIEKILWKMCSSRTSWSVMDGLQKVTDTERLSSW